MRSGPNEWNNWIWTYGSGSTDYGTLTNNDGDTNRIDAGLSSVGPGTQIDHGDSYPDVSTPTYVNLYDVPTSGEFSGIGDLTYQGDLGTIGAPYTTIDAVNNPGIIGDQRVSPHEWNDWTWTYGSGSTDYGTLTSNDDDTNRIDAESFSGTVSDTGFKTPNGDIYNDPYPQSPGSSGWFSSPLWSKLGAFDGSLIYAISPWYTDAAVAIADVSIPAGSYVTKIDLDVFGYYYTGGDSTFTVQYRIGTGGWSSAKDVTFTAPTPAIKYATWDNLWSNQYDDADMDDLQIRLYCLTGTLPHEQRLDRLQVKISYAPEIYQHVYDIKLDINDISMSSIQNLRYEWQQTAARNTRMYIYDGSDYQTLVNHRGFSTAYYTGSWALTSPYIQNGDEVWLRIVSSPGGDFDVRFDQLYIEYSILAADYEISKIVEWNALGAAVMDTLTYDYDDATVAFEIYDYTTGYWDNITGSPFTLGPEHVSGGDTIKVRYSKSSSSTFTLNIDQLRVDYRDGWSVSPSGTAVAAVAVISDNKFLESYTDSGSGGDTIDFSMANWPFMPGTLRVEEIKITTTALYEGLAPTLNVYFQIEGGWSSGKSQSMQTTYTTQTLSWTGLYGNQWGGSSINGMKIRFETIGGSGPSITKIDRVYVTVIAASARDYYTHEYHIKWDVNDISMSSIQNLHYEWQQTAARNTKMYIYDGSDYQTLVNDRGSSTAYYTGSWSLTSPYIQNGDEVWLYIVSDEGDNFDVRFDQLYIEYTNATQFYEISKIVEWSATNPTSMDTLTYAHYGTTVAFEIYDYIGQDYETITGSPFTLQSKYVSGGNTIKVRYTKVSSSDFTLNVDQLRIDYTYLDHTGHWVDAEVEWLVSDPELYSMDYLRFTHSAPVSVTFEVYDWVQAQFETPPTGTPLNLQTYPEYYDSSTKTVKVHYLTANHTSPFDLQIDQLRVDYRNKFDYYSVNAEAVWDLTDIIQSVNFLSYSHKTTETVNCIMEIWDFADTEWDLVNSSTNINGFYDTQFDLSDSRYRDGSDNVKLRYRTAELMETPFNLLIDRLKVDYTTVRDAHKIDFEVIWDITDVTFNLMEFIKYSHKTNVSIDIDVDIYNFTSQTWFEIESVINSQTFDDDSFALSSDFYNGSNHVRLRFQSDTWETFNEEGFKL